MSVIEQNIKLTERVHELVAELNLHKSETAHSMVMCKCTKSYRLASESVCKVCKIEQLEAEIKGHEANIKLRADHVGKLQAELDKLKEFARKVIGGYCWGVPLDGLDIQELAGSLELIEPRTATEADVDDESDYEVGDSIYKFTKELEQDG
jgi:hypothetical protein